MRIITFGNTTFLSNNDLSGGVVILSNGVEITVPGEALLGFVADHIRRERISAIEDATDEEILFGGVK